MDGTTNTLGRDPAFIDCTDCGWTPKLVKVGRLRYIECTNPECRIRGPFRRSKQKAVEWWNRVMTRAAVNPHMARALDEYLMSGGMRQFQIRNVMRCIEALDKVEKPNWRDLNTSKTY